MPGVWGVLEAPRALGCWVCGRPGALARPLTGPRASNRPPTGPASQGTQGLRPPGPTLDHTDFGKERRSRQAKWVGVGCCVST